MKWMDEGINKCSNKWTNKSVNESFSESMNEWKNLFILWIVDLYISGF